MTEKERECMKTTLENFCNDKIQRKGEVGKGWAFGAIEFAYIAKIISYEENIEISRKTWNKEEV